jgi:hypothetical protein
MAVTCVGYKNGKYQIKESDPGIKLKFPPFNEDKFEQVDEPTGDVKEVGFSLTESFLRKEFPGFLPSIQ